jgi:DHA2 family multidrug resistance protein
MVRDLGGAFGIAALQTFLTKRAPFHSNVLTQHVPPFVAATQARIEDPTACFPRHGSRPAAYVEPRFLTPRRTIP